MMGRRFNSLKKVPPKWREASGERPDIKLGLA
jgi:hypothetical protein